MDQVGERGRGAGLEADADGGAQAAPVGEEGGGQEDERDGRRQGLEVDSEGGEPFPHLPSLSSPPSPHLSFSTSQASCMSCLPPPRKLR